MVFPGKGWTVPEGVNLEGTPGGYRGRWVSWRVGVAVVVVVVVILVVDDDDDVDDADKDVAIFAGEVSAPSSDGCCCCDILRCNSTAENSR